MEYSDFEDISLGRFSLDDESLVILFILEIVILVADFIYLSLGFWVASLKINELIVSGFVVGEEY